MQDRDQAQTEAAADDKPKQAEFRQANPGDNPIGEDGKTERQREVEHSQAQARRQQQAAQRNEADDERRQRAVGEFRRDPNASRDLQQGGGAKAAPVLDPRNRPPGERDSPLDGQSDEQRAAEVKKVEAEAGGHDKPKDLGGAAGNGGVAAKPDDGSQQGDGANTDGKGAGDGEHGKGSDV